jgi:hypothetical protein
MKHIVAAMFSNVFPKTGNNQTDFAMAGAGAQGDG